MVSANFHERITTLLFYVVVIWLGYILYRIFEPFLVPLAWAAVMTIFFFPLQARLERHWRPGVAALATTIIVTLIVVVPILLIATAFVREGFEAANDIQAALASGRFQSLQNLWGRVEAHVPGSVSINFTSLVDDGARRLTSFLASSAGTLLQNVALFVFDLVITLFATFFFFRDARAIMDVGRRLLPFEDPLRERMIRQAGALVSAGVTASIAVAAVQGALGGGAFALLGIDAPVFWGVVMAFFCILPLGAWVVWLPAALWLIATGATLKGVLLIALGVGIVSLADNFLRPALISESVQMNGLIIFISLLGGISVFGLLGVVLGPILVATAAGLIDAYMRELTNAKRDATIPSP
jgi:predicted PurR-regulated permease PerM